MDYWKNEKQKIEEHPPTLLEKWLKRKKQIKKKRKKMEN